MGQMLGKKPSSYSAPLNVLNDLAQDKVSVHAKRLVIIAHHTFSSFLILGLLSMLS